MVLTEREMDRYSRQMMIEGWGVEGQVKLKKARVVVVGSGGLGSPILIYLAAGGVGEIVVVDKDNFELSNLNRQILGWERDVGGAKAIAVSEKVRSLNSDVSVLPKVMEISEENIEEVVDGADVVVDALDNWETRFTVNEVCVERGIPFVHAGIYGLSGQATTIIPGKGPCLRCIIPGKPREAGLFPVVGATPGLFAMIEVMEVFKLIIGFGETLVGQILVFNGEDMSFNKFAVSRNPDCVVCGGLRP
jgi:molybdopterin/thiamine biosynthesis adenylyltransferase